MVADDDDGDGGGGTRERYLRNQSSSSGRERIRGKTVGNAVNGKPVRESCIYGGEEEGAGDREAKSTVNEEKEFVRSFLVA